MYLFGKSWKANNLKAKIRAYTTLYLILVLFETPIHYL